MFVFSVVMLEGISTLLLKRLNAHVQWTTLYGMFILQFQLISLIKVDRIAREWLELQLFEL